ncbi:hypothetical protein DCCM_4908 [Desulfocucumis palustris]|uniref:Uncharacterized protein n=1 Tax=Desulfocucumis palustris TaxID=1898651 RepID=A0A2L2XJ77_9FIRM|nr:ABC transporter permease [Desulfocucumis palustris]GBF35773.1 hypothetical protein DCCM_4908 [Desulfocucumis palustris]
MKKQLTSYVLWKRRILFDWKLYWNEWKSVADPATLIYIIIPYMLFAVYMYKSLLESLPIWIALFSVSMPQVLLLVRPLLIFYNTRLVAADLIFLGAGPWNARSFVYYSMVLQWFRESMANLFMMLVLYPFLLHLLSFSIKEAIFLAALLSIWQITWLNLTFVLRNKNEYLYLAIKWAARILVLIPAAYGPLRLQACLRIDMVWVLSMFVLVLSLVLVYVQNRWDWHMLVEESDKNRMSIISSLIPREKRRKYVKKPVLPIMTRRWTDGFSPEKISMELFVKIFLRRKNDMKINIVMLIAGSLLICSAGPLPSRMLFYIFTIFLLHQFFKNSQKDIDQRLWHRLAPIGQAWKKGQKGAIYLLVSISAALLLIPLLI